MPVQVVAEHRAGLGRSDGAQCSWKLDNSTASSSAGSSSTSSTGTRRYCRTARRGAAISMACSIDVVVVLCRWLVTSQLRGAVPAASSRQANSTSPRSAPCRGGRGQ